jgi:purine-nucleoside phosphorylase
VSAEIVRRLDEAASRVRAASALRPTIGLVLGSGLGAFAETLEEAVGVPYSEIPHFPTSTAEGHRGALVIGRSGGTPVAVMAGRVHFYEGYSPEQVVFPVRVLGRMGVRTLVVTNAAGAVNTAFAPGQLMILLDHINLMGQNPLVGPNPEPLGPRFPDMSRAYDPELVALADDACHAAGLTAHHGVYIAFPGPSYETPAEIRMARGLGADAVGMSTVPEAIAARHMGMRVLGISCLTNMAAGVLDQALDHREVLAVGERVRSGLLDVLARLVRALAERG